MSQVLHAQQLIRPPGCCTVNFHEAGLGLAGRARVNGGSGSGCFADSLGDSQVLQTVPRADDRFSLATRDLAEVFDLPTQWIFARHVGNRDLEGLEP